MKPAANPAARLIWDWSYAAIIAVGLLSYFAIYFAQLITPEVPQLGTRGVIFLRALLPDAVYRDWTANGTLTLGLLDRVPLWIAAALWYGLAWWIGDAVLQRLPLIALRTHASPTKALAVRHPLAITLGLGMLSLTTLMVGWLGWLRPATGMISAVVIWIALGIFSYVQRKRCVALCPTTRSESLPGSAYPLMRHLMRLLQLVLAVCGFYYSIAATMAPVEFDVLEYHLQAPKEFWQQGAISFLPHNVYANMPLGIEMHALAWMSLVGGNDGWWWGALIGKVIIGWMAPLTAWLLAASLFEFSRRENATSGERDQAILIALGGAILYLTLPGIAEVSQFGQIDAALGLYVLATVVVAFHFSFRCNNDHLYTTVILLGLFAGLAFAAKYPGIMFAVLPAGLVILAAQFWRPVDKKSLAKQLALFGVGVLVTAGPWLAKSTLLSGNPVYPLAGNVFGGKTIDAEKIEQWQKAHAIPVIKDAQGNEIRYSWSQAVASVQQLAYKSPIPSSIFVPMFLLGAFYSPRRETWWWLVWLAAGLSVWWFMSHRLDRFWLPLLPIAAWLAARSILPLLNTAAGIPLAVVLTIGVSHSLLFFASPPVNDPRYLVSLNAQRNDWKGEEFTRVSKAIGWMNEKLQTTDRVLMVGQAAIFDLAIPCDYSTCFDESKWDDIAASATPAERLQKFKDYGITHVCIHWGEIERYRGPGNYGFRSKITQPQVAEFISAGLLSVVDVGQELNGVSLLKVSDAL